ncbi:unnamed protein product, partial [Mesorhabditis belari]|uniref:Ubiquitin carboxyl-terminal hydrolase n=1 Tax=Mesorhabditis belari TaxID=2138241 RepID=A0AAF3J2G4_9BILA
MLHRLPKPNLPQLKLTGVQMAQTAHVAISEEEESRRNHEADVAKNKYASHMAEMDHGAARVDLHFKTALKLAFGLMHDETEIKEALQIYQFLCDKKITPSDLRGKGRLIQAPGDPNNVVFEYTSGRGRRQFSLVDLEAKFEKYRSAQSPTAIWDELFREMKNDDPMVSSVKAILAIPRIYDLIRWDSSYDWMRFALIVIIEEVSMYGRPSKVTLSLVNAGLSEPLIDHFASETGIWPTHAVQIGDGTGEFELLEQEDEVFSGDVNRLNPAKINDGDHEEIGDPELDQSFEKAVSNHSVNTAILNDAAKATLRDESLDVTQSSVAENELNACKTKPRAGQDVDTITASKEEIDDLTKLMAEASFGTPSMTSNEGAEHMHFETKKISFGEIPLRIVLQKVNGACPLLAIVNALALKGRIKQAVDEEGNYNKALTDVINLIPTLNEGLIINVDFPSPHDFEFTPALSWLELVGLNLVHGWLPDPQLQEYCTLFGSMSYTQAQIKMIEKGGDTDGLIIGEFLNTTANQLTYYGIAEEDGSLTVMNLLNLAETSGRNDKTNIGTAAQKNANVQSAIAVFGMQDEQKQLSEGNKTIGKQNEGKYNWQLIGKQNEIGQMIVSAQTKQDSRTCGCFKPLLVGFMMTVTIVFFASLVTIVFFLGSNVEGTTTYSPGGPRKRTVT